MPYPKNPIGDCPACGEAKGVPLVRSRFIDGDVRVCKKCSNAARHAAAAGGKKTPKTPAPAKAKKAAAKPKAAAPPPPDPPMPRIPSAVETGHANGRAIVISVTCHEVADIRRVLAATEGMSVAVGLAGVA